MSASGVNRKILHIDDDPQLTRVVGHMLQRKGYEVVALNTPEAALGEIEPLGTDPRMRSYQPYWAARGHLLALAGRKAEAHEALTLAIGLSADKAVRRYLQGKLAALQDG